MINHLILSVASVIAMISVTSSAAVAQSAAPATGLVLTVTDDRSTVRPAGNLVYAITLVQNSAISSPIDVELVLPAGVSTVTPEQGGRMVGSNVRWDDVSLLQGQSRRLTVSINLRSDIAEGTMLVAIATADGVIARDETVVQTSIASEQQTYSITLSDDRVSAAPGDVLTYALRVRNISATNRTDDVRFSLPPFIDLASIEPVAAPNGQMITWAGQVFAPNEEKLFTVRATVRRNAPEFFALSAQAAVGALTVSDSTSVQTGVSSTASVSSSSRSSSMSSESRSASSMRSTLLSANTNTIEVVPGGELRLNISVRNVLLQRITDGVLTLRIDPSMASVTDRAGAVQSEGGVLRWNLSSLAPGESWSRTVVVRVSSSVSNGSIIRAVATIEGNDVSSATLEEKARTVAVNVVQTLPPTGAAYDVIFVGISLIASSGMTYAIGRKRRSN